MTQTILDISLSFDGFATAANVRPEEPIGDGQGWVYGTQRGYSARDPEGNLWSFGTMSPGAWQ